MKKKKKKKRTSVLWTAPEDAVIRRLRARGWDFDRIAEKLPDRTVVAVKRRVAHLMAKGLIAAFRVPWSDAENDLLCDLRARGVSATSMTAHFKDRTRDAIRNQLRLLEREGRIEAKRPGTSRPAWTNRDEALLFTMRDAGATLNEIAVKLRRSRAGVATKASTLIDAEELPRATASPLSNRSWTNEENELVATMRQAGKPASEMADVLDRSIQSVESHIAHLVRKGDLELMQTRDTRKILKQRAQ